MTWKRSRGSARTQVLRIEDRISIAHMMRSNLASDIIAGYGIQNVSR